MPTASSDAVCKRTIKRRSIEIEEHRSMISKGFLDLQLQSELRLVSKVERQKLMESINSIEVDPCIRSYNYWNPMLRKLNCTLQHGLIIFNRTAPR